MNVRELIAWLQQYPNQEASVEVVVHEIREDDCWRGGVADCWDFDPTATLPTYEEGSGVLVLGRYGDPDSGGSRIKTMW